MNTPVEPLYAMTLPALVAVPPIMLLYTEVAMSTPYPTFPMATVPETSVPILFPWITVPGEPFVTKTPNCLFPEITLPAPAAVPPIGLFDPSIRTPENALPRLWVPEASVPISLPRIWLLDPPKTRTPSMSLPEITLRAVLLSHR